MIIIDIEIKYLFDRETYKMDSVLYLCKFYQFSNNSTRTTKKLKIFITSKVEGQRTNALKYSRD